jgi:hypothetical protein
LNSLDIYGGKLLTQVLRSFVLMMMVAPVALAQEPGSRMYVGQDIYVAQGQQIHNASCFFCSVQVEGDLTGNVFVLFGSLNVSGRVHGHATVLGGNAVIDAQARVGGDTVVLGGNAVYETDESLSGSAYVLGGHLSRVARPEGSRQRRISMSPMFFGLLGVLALLLLSAAVVPRVRRRPVVKQSS